MNEETIRVAILSPTLAVRVGLRALIETDNDIEVVAEAIDLAALWSPTQEVDVVVIASGAESVDTWGGSLSGSSLDIPILLLSDNLSDIQILAGLSVPAWGVLSLDASEEELAAAIHAINLGLNISPPEYLELVLTSSRFSDDEELVEALTPRESEVMELLAQGLANKQIALALDISEHTVKFHISAIYRKMGVTNRTEAVRIGMRLGLVLL